MKQVYKSIIDLKNGAIKEVIEEELEKIIGNIKDENTDPTKKRSITITLTFRGNADRSQIFMTSVAKTKLEPIKPVEITLLNCYEENHDTGEMFPVLKELTSIAPGQIDFDGNIFEPEVVLVGKNAVDVVKHHPQLENNSNKQ